MTKFEINLFNLYMGEVPLYKSYWLYYVFGNFIISFPLLFASSNIIQKFLFSFSLYLIINMSYYFLTCLGVWKSSQNYTKNKILALLAKFIVVLGFSTTIFELKNIIKIIY